MFDRYCELAPDNDDIDDAVYDVICEWDEQFAGDNTWCNDEETDVKDRLRDEVLEMLGERHSEEAEEDGCSYNFYICRYCFAFATDDPDCSKCGKEMCVLLYQEKNAVIAQLRGMTQDELFTHFVQWAVENWELLDFPEPPKLGV